MGVSNRHGGPEMAPKPPTFVAPGKAVGLLDIAWSGKRDSNPRPPAWKAGALPLSYSRGAPHASKWRGGELLDPRRRLTADLQSAPFCNLRTSPHLTLLVIIPPTMLITLLLLGGIES